MLKIPDACVNEAFRACLSVFCCRQTLHAKTLHAQTMRKKTAAACAQRFFVEVQCIKPAGGACADCAMCTLHSTSATASVPAPVPVWPKKPIWPATAETRHS